MTKFCQHNRVLGGCHKCDAEVEALYNKSSRVTLAELNTLNYVQRDNLTLLLRVNANRGGDHGDTDPRAGTGDAASRP